MRNNSLRVSIVMLGLFGLANASLSYAQKAGDTLVSIGGSYIMNFSTPTNSSKVNSITIPNSTLGAPAVGTIYPNGLYQQGLGTQNRDLIVPMLWFQRYLTDNISLTNYLTWPPTAKIEGRGTSDKYGTLITYKQFTPTYALTYTFGQPSDKFRAFLGPSMTFVWAINPKVVNQDWIKNELGNADYVKVKVPMQFAPGLLMGANYWLNDNLYLRGIAAYIPVTSRSQLTIRSRTLPKSDVLPPSTKPLPEGQNYEVRSTSTVKANSLLLSFGVGYRFDFFND